MRAGTHGELLCAFAEVVVMIVARLHVVYAYIVDLPKVAVDGSEMLGGPKQRRDCESWVVDTEPVEGLGRGGRVWYDEEGRVAVSSARYKVKVFCCVAGETSLCGKERATGENGVDP